ncbi:unnamed protein product [Penicillium salamii]|uniref:WSC domain-containing protein n=1 Tax=Penicillium salamii TaxID=1612424 RepID=A0A9W4IPI7_9EURO|nr:unnamed protein product [Penicillium salamii]CAG8044054.1 unnamed protein product [Penicillium salamii]CAG8334807.1 unnamed protein product [Penicillium salamii]CAG8335054.1 unnamed protein product [Penicillium salamii]CAG8343491.1 unnamed protein product [Penicillium salamii]
MHATFILSALALALPVYSASSETVGCYSEIGSMKSQGPFTFQSPGHCEDQCSKKGFKIAALGRGDMCYCGDQLPSQSAKVDDDQCDIKCSGWPEATCGGKGTYNLIQGTEVSSDDSDSASTTAAPTAVTAAGGIVVAAPSTAAAPTGIVTAASSVNSKSANASKSGSATSSAKSSASPTPTDNAAGSIRVGSSLVGAAIAGMGLLL